MSHENGFDDVTTFVLNGENKLREYKESDVARNGFETSKESSSHFLAPCREKKFENLQEYLLEVSKRMGQRQSFYSMDFADILWKIQKWRKTLPNVEIFYAVKANPDPLLLKLMVLLGTSFDCATEGEIKAVLRAGASPDSILWAHTIKPVEGLLYARRVGVDTMTFDNEEELYKMHKVFPDASFHVGGLCTEPDSFTSTIRDCREIFDQARRMGCPLSILDIGGGFFGASGTQKIFDEITGSIKETLDEYFSDQQVRVIAEPGCYVVGSAVNLVCTIIGKRSVQDTGDVQRHYFLNNGIYGSFFRDIEYYGIRPRPLLSEQKSQTRRKYKSVLYGQTCCSEDIIQKQGCLPDMEMGECLMWENMGAYSSPLCGTFCGVPIPKTVYVFVENKELIPSDTPGYESVKDLLLDQAVFIGGSGDVF